MADESDSFSASGPTTVAFETITNRQVIGVGASGSQCGVFGSSAVSQGSRPPSSIQNGTGVCGLGDDVGVFGGGPIGVSGDGTNLGIFGRSLSTGVKGEGGTTGVHGEGNTGVHGEGKLIGIEAKHQSDRISIDAAAISGEAVENLGGESAVAIRGWSANNRAAIFSTGQLQRKPQQLETDSVVVAQTHLVPVSAAKPPARGSAGDLLALRNTSIKRKDVPTELWFCVKSSRGTVPSFWIKLA